MFKTLDRQAGWLVVNRWTEADVEVDFVEVDGGIHGFNMAEDSPLAAALDAAAVECVRTHNLN